MSLSAVRRRPPWLTSRGTIFLLVGAALTLVGILGALPPAAMFGVLVGLLPIAAALLTQPPSGELALERGLSARELPSGGVLDVTLTVRGRLPRGHSLLVEDEAPAALGGPHRVALRAPGGRRSGTAHYRTTAEGRGQHRLGPVRVHTVDPFGLVHRVHSIDLRDSVLVHPRVVEVDPLVLGGASMSTGTGLMGAPGATADDVVPRAYRPGDEVRRLDWKATARTGDLMVRSEESLRRSALTLVLDMCDDHHHGREPRSSCDALLEAAASVGVMALGEGWDVEVRTTDDVVVYSGSPGTGVTTERRELLRALATLPIDGDPIPAITLRHSLQSTGPVLLLLGAGGAAWARTLASLAAHSTRRMVLAVVADQWRPATAAAWRGPGVISAAAPPEELVAQFRAAGWRIALLERDNPTGAAWSELGGRR